MYRALHRTPTRLRRLAEVRDAKIHRYGDGQDYDENHFRVTAGMAEMQRAGWVELGEAGAVKTVWRLTEAGEHALGEVT